jgi:hypothetical protein
MVTELVFMNTNIDKAMLLTKSCFTGTASKTGCFLLMLLTLLLLIPGLTQADGLFDFQMKLAKKGNAEAEYKVGEMYETGFGVKEDQAEAMVWISKAANQGHETAGFKLLYWDIKKNGVTEDNNAKFEVLKAKAKEGNAQAQYYLGKMYSQGVGVKKDTKKALVLLNKAAFVGVLEAEREAVFVREDQQREIIAKRKADEKKRVQLKVKKEKERLAKIEQQKKLQAQKQADAKAKSKELAKKNKASADARSKAAAAAATATAANLKAKEQAKSQRLTQQQAAKKQAEKREAEKRALIKKREEEQKNRKAQFESDPCSGKSARFLSTCR